MIIDSRVHDGKNRTGGSTETTTRPILKAHDAMFSSIILTPWRVYKVLQTPKVHFKQLPCLHKKSYNLTHQQTLH